MNWNEKKLLIILLLLLSAALLYVVGTSTSLIPNHSTGNQMNRDKPPENYLLYFRFRNSTDTMNTKEIIKYIRENSKFYEFANLPGYTPEQLWKIKEKIETRTSAKSLISYNP
jgi:hypothetical protein